MPLLITGGAGFVLSNLARHWLETDPAATVVLLDAAPLDTPAERFFAPVRARLQFLQGDVLDPAAWAALPPGITQVAHGATITPTAERERATPRQIVEVNTLGTVNALEWARGQAALKRFIYVSSGSVYSEDLPLDPAPPVREDDPVTPDGLYGASKYASELITRRYGEVFGLDTASVRLSSVYGPMDRDTPARAKHSLPYQLAHRAAAGQPIRLNALEGGGDWIHAQDVARALTALLRAERLRHAVYNVAYGEFVTAGQLVAIMREAVPGLDSAVAPEAAANLVLDPQRRRGRWNAYDVSRLAEEFGWRPRPLRDALLHYLAWLKANE